MLTLLPVPTAKVIHRQLTNCLTRAIEYVIYAIPQTGHHAMTDRTRLLLHDILLLAQLACDSHKKRSARLSGIARRIALLNPKTTKAHMRVLREHILQSSDAVEADLRIENNQLVIETPINIDMEQLNKRVLW